VKIVRDFESNIQNFQKIKSTDPLKKDFDDMKERGVNIHLTTLKEYAAKILMMRGDNRAFEFIKQ
jgi:hypothetical protein